MGRPRSGLDIAISLYGVLLSNVFWELDLLGPALFWSQVWLPETKGITSPESIMDAIRRLAAGVEPSPFDCIPWPLLAGAGSAGGGRHCHSVPPFTAIHRGCF